MTAAVALAAFAATWLVLVLFAAGLHRVTKRPLDTLAPETRAALLLGLALLPLVLAVLVAVLGFAPAIGGLIVDEHCHAATGCASHIPVVHAEALYAAALLLAAGSAVAVLLWSVARRLRRSLHVARALQLFAERSTLESYEIIDSRERFAYCIGLLRPRVVLSRGLVDRLSPKHLEVVLRHEHAHATRRDNLRAWLAGLALLPLPIRLKQPLVADLALAAEQACDRAAAAAVGAADVLATLAALAPDARATGRRGALATLDSPTTIPRRIAALEDRRRGLPRFAVHATIAIVYAACAVLATDAAHHGTEILFALL